jgi:Ala-tRNA(Pro) deacylase
MRITEYLDQRKVNYQISTHRPSFTSQKMAAEEHISGMNVAKPVIIQADGKYYMCVLPACCKVDLDSLRSQLGAGDIELANEEDMAGLFPDCELGAEPPVGTMFGLTTLMDKSLMEDEYIVFQAGKHDQAIKLNLRDYEELVHPRVLTFSYHLH